MIRCNRVLIDDPREMSSEWECAYCEKKQRGYTFVFEAYDDRRTEPETVIVCSSEDCLKVLIADYWWDALQTIRHFNEMD